MRDSNVICADEGSGRAVATLEARAIQCLAELDDAREGLREVLLRLARQKFPVGGLVDLDRVSVIVGDPHAAKRARIRWHQTPEVDLARPELTGITLECVTLRRDGLESDNVVWVKIYLLNGAAADPLVERRHLIEMVHALECGGDVSISKAA